MADPVPLAGARAARRYGAARGEGDAQLFPEFRRDKGWRVPTERGRWSIFDDGAGERLWRWEGSKDEGDWEDMVVMPAVVARVVNRDATGEVTAVRVLLRFGTKTERLCAIDADELRAALVAADVPAPGEPHVCQVLATAIGIAAQGAPEIESVPSMEGGTLALPPRQISPAGYGEVVEIPVAKGRELWREAGWIAVVNPNLALTLGAAWSGLFVAALDWPECPWLHLLDDTSRGKTSSLRLAASLVGDPRAVLRPMNFTSVGLSTRLGELGCVPGFFDELGAAGLTAAALEAVIYRIAGGASRLVGTRDGRTRESAVFRSALLTSGNASLAHVTESAGLVARIIELTTPMLSSGIEAKRISELAMLGYGWPLMMANGELDAELFEAWRKGYRESLGELDGVVGRVADTLSLFCAGAEMLGELLDVPPLGEKALEAALAVLDGLQVDLEERGQSMGERLLEAVMNARAARPFAFPDLVKWQAAFREVEGLVIDDESLGILPAALRAIAKAAGIEDPLPGLRQLAEDGRLRRGAAGHLTKRRRLGLRSAPVTFYELSTVGLDDDPARAAARAPRPPGARVSPQFGSGQSAPDQGSGEGCGYLRAPRAPRAPQIARSRTENAVDNLSSADLYQLAHLREQRESAARDEEMARTARLDEVLHGPTIGSYLSPAPQIAPERPPESPLLSSDDEEIQMAVLVLEAHEGKVSVVVRPGSVAGRVITPAVRVTFSEAPNLAGVLALAEGYGAELVWITLPAAVAIGSAGWAWADGFWEEAEGWNLRRSAPRSWFAYREGERGEGVHVIWGPADESAFSQLNPSELARALSAFKATHGIGWPGSGGGAFQAMLRRSHKGARGRGLKDLGPSIEPAFAAEERVGEQGLDWCRPSVSSEGEYLHAYDRNGAFLSVLGETRWGIGEPTQLLGAQSFDPEERRPGWWRVKLSPREPWPAELPVLLTANRRGGEYSWVTTPTALFIAKDLGRELNIGNAWVWEQSLAYLRTLQTHLRDARRAVVELRGTPAGDALYEAHKAVYSEGINWWRANFHADALSTSGGLTSGPPSWRPNAQAQVSALARVNLVRAAKKTVEQSGISPVAAFNIDELVYRSAIADPIEAAEAIGLKLGAGLGQFKPKGTIPAGKVGRGGSAGVRYIEEALQR